MKMLNETKAASMNLAKIIFRSRCSVRGHKIYLRYNNGLVRVMTPYETPR